VEALKLLQQRRTSAYEPHRPSDSSKGDSLLYSSHVKALKCRFVYLILFLCSFVLFSYTHPNYLSSRPHLFQIKSTIPISDRNNLVAFQMDKDGNRASLIAVVGLLLFFSIALPNFSHLVPWARRRRRRLQQDILRVCCPTALHANPNGIVRWSWLPCHWMWPVAHCSRLYSSAMSQTLRLSRWLLVEESQSHRPTYYCRQ